MAAHMERHGDTLGTRATDGGGTGNAGDVARNGSPNGHDIYGDSAADNPRGTPNADFLQGGRGPDTMLASTNDDYTDGIGGNDVIDGGRGIDHRVGDKGDTFKYCDGNVVEVPVPSGG